MSLKLPVLVRGINNLSDARYCAGMGADGLVFTLDPALPGAVDAATVQELAGWVSGVELLGEFDQLPAADINALAAACGLRRVVLRRPRPAAELAALDVPALLETAPADVPAAADPAHFGAAGLLVELGAAELTADLLAALAAAPLPLWLGPHLDAAAARAALDARLPQLAGLVLPGGDETQPGLRDFAELEAVFEALEDE